ncbi:CARDB domain-containing protein [Roseimaritima ulvae]|uniref:tRNA(Glu)-specific nuclease WapA n=1 Tax=Roseimaritima ulvae TaxID=980254 RepID=A0A5B9QU03_9BACT|nr:CARDB domain-containing protein [Roseimaritima ulvae]QEG41240.1 tRNA(Glu)-specific nuclease WapA precursor [Roseimaritima ulvae]
MLEDRRLLAAFSDLESVAPLGSLVVANTESSTFGTVSETDSYTIELAGGQTATVLFKPIDTGIQGQLAVTNPNGISLGQVDAVTTGDSIELSSLAISDPGTYQIDATSLAGVGAYELTVALNAVNESEVLGIANDTIGDAQPIDGQPTLLPGPSDRFAVRGNTDAAGDFFSFSLDSGQFATLAVTGGDLATSVELYDDSGTLLAQGVDSGAAGNTSIEDFRASANGVYIARVTGGIGSEFNLMVVRDSSFDREASAESPQDISRTSRVLSHLGGEGFGAAVPNELEPNASITAATDFQGNFVNSGEDTYFGEVQGSIDNSSDADYFRIWASPGDTIDVRQFGGSLGDPYLYLYNNTGRLLASNDDTFGLQPRILYSFGSANSNYAGDYYIRADAYSSHVGSYTMTVELQSNAPLGIQDNEDFYGISVASGDVLTISTTTPGDGSGEPRNDLDPIVELYDADNVLVASNNNGPDGRNALIQDYHAVDAGTYIVRVAPVVGSGAYTLNVVGATGVADPALEVSSTSIMDGTTVTAFPNSIDIEFSDPILLSSLNPDDLTVNHIAASAVSILNATTARFDLSGLSSGDGPYTFSLASDAIENLQGTGNDSFSATLTLDTIGPSVVSTSLLADEVIAPGDLTFSATLDEDLDASSLDASDVILLEQLSGNTVVPDSLVYDSDADTLTVTFPGLNDGRYTLSLFGDEEGLQDLVGNTLQGNTGIGSATYELPFVVDTAQRPLPVDFRPVVPLGSLISEASYRGGFDAPGDTDEYTIELDAGQTATILLLPEDETLAGSIILYDPNDQALGTVNATAGQPVLLQTAAISETGTYRIAAGSLLGDGTFDLQVYLNTAFEPEAAGGTGNDDFGTADDLAASFISLGSDRAAVVGRSDGETGDHYRFFLAAGQSASVVLTSTDPSADIQLLASDGTPLAVGVDSSWNVSRKITNFTTTVDDDFVVAVSGHAGAQYSLVVSRDLQFSYEPNDSLASAQRVEDGDSVLGHIGGAGSIEDAIQVAVHSSSNAIVNQLNDDTFFNFNAVNVTGSQIDTVAELAAYDVVIIGDSNVHGQLDGAAAALRTFVETGGGLVATGWSIYSAGASTAPVISDIDAIVPVDTTVPYQWFNSGTVSIVDATHPVTSGLSDIAYSSHIEYSTGGIDPGARVLATIGGHDVVVVSNSGRGRSAYLGPVYPHGNFSTGAADQLLEQTVAWAAGDSTDTYQFLAEPGDWLRFSTSTPFDGGGDVNNRLNPRLTLYAPDGSELLSDDDGLDDKNASLNYTVPSDGGGTYYVVVESADGSSGEYVLMSTGYTGESGFTAAAIDPTNGAYLDAAPSEVAVQFSDAFLLTTLTADDLTVNGTPATSYQLVDGRTVVFQIPALGEGTHTLEIATNAVLDLRGTPLDGITSTFTNDFSGPRVVSTSIQQGDVVQSGDLIYTVSFNEPIAESNLDSQDVSLWGIGRDNVYSPTTFRYDSETQTLTIGYESLPEDNYRLTLASGDGRFEDPLGNDLDGEPLVFPIPDNLSGDGNNGGDFFVEFTLDNITDLVPTPLQELSPAGSLLYSETVSGLLEPTGDVDTFTINLDANQVVSVLLTPSAGDLVGRLELNDPSGNPVASVAASAAGQPAWLQSAAVDTAGVYEIRVEGTAGAGEFSLELYLNAALEDESVQGVTNDTLSTAENIDVSAVATFASANRLAVLGHTDAAATLSGDDAETPDFFSFTLAAGTYNTIALTAASREDELQLELYDSAGQLLTIGVPDAKNVDRFIEGFSPTATDTFTARVSGAEETPYSLVVTRGSAFDLEFNDRDDDPQNLGSATQVVGGLSRSSAQTSGGASVAVVHGTDISASSLAGFNAIVDQLNDDTYFDFTASLVAPTDIDTVEELMQYDAVVIGNTGRSSSSGDSFGTYAAALQQWVENESGAVVMTGWGIYGSGNESSTTIAAMEAILPVNLSGYTYQNSGVVTLNGVEHPVVEGVSTFSVANTYVEVPSGTPAVDADAIVLATTVSRPSVAVRTSGSGRVVYLGPVYSAASTYPTTELRSGDPDRLLEQAVNWAGGNDATDQFAFQVSNHDQLTIFTKRLGEGNGEPQNSLDPVIELYDSAGNLVASNDNADGSTLDALVSYNVPSDGEGIYRVKLIAGEGSGDYSLQIEGATATAPPLVVAATDTSDGTELNTFPTALRVDLSQPVILTSVHASDLTVNGTSAVSVTALDADTLEFDISGANQGDGIYEVTLSGLTSLGGVDLSQFVMTFDVEATAPFVTSSSIDDGQSLSPGDLSYVVTFSEPLNAAELGAEDVTLVDHISGATFNASNFIYDDSTHSLTVSYTDLPQGNYTLTLASDPDAFRDRRDNLLDGSPSFPLPSGDGLSGDDFVLEFQLDVDTTAYPVPLEPIDPLGSLVFGSDVTGAISSDTDLDAFTVDIDAGQQVSLALVPDGALIGTVELVAPDGGSTQAVASAAGDAAVLQNVLAVEAGTYTIRVGGTGAASNYTLQLVLNATLESETYGGAANNDTSFAQEINDSFIELPGGADRAAVLGIADGIDFQEAQTQTGNVFSGNVLAFNYDNAPTPAGSASLTITVRADLDGSTEYLTLAAEGIFLENLFVSGGSQGGTVTTTLAIPQNQLEQLLADGTIAFTVTPSGSVDNFITDNFLTLDLNYARSGEPDVYRFHLAQDQVATLAVAGLGEGGHQLELLDADGDLFTIGQQGWSNVAVAVVDFVAPVAGDYYARIRGNSDYSFVVTRGIGFNTVANAGGERPLGPSNAILTHGGSYASQVLADGPVGYWRLGESSDSVAVDDSDSDISGVYNGVTLGQPGAVFGDPDTAAFFAGGSTNQFVEIPDDVRLHGNRQQTVSGWFKTNGFDKTWQSIYWKGDTPDCSVNCQNRENTLWINRAGYLHFTSTPSGASTQLTLDTAAGLVQVGRWHHFATVIDADSNQMLLYLDGTLAASRSYSTAGIKDTSGPWRLARTPSETTELNGFLDEIAIFNHSLSSAQIQNQYDAGTEGVSVSDYTFEANEGDQLLITTTTPGDEFGQPLNLFDPALELYNELGFLVGADTGGASDGRNVRLSYTVPEGNGGQYRIRVSGIHDGDLTLRVNGASASNERAPFVVATSPVDGEVFSTPPNAIDLTFSEPFRIDTLNLTDLIIDNGGSVSDVQVLSAVTARFVVDLPDVEAAYTYTLATDRIIDLQQQGNLAYSGSLLIDKTGPYVVDQSPQLQASAPFSELTFVFSEPIDAETFTTADVVSFTGPGGVNLISAISGVSVDGNQATVQFNAQSVRGTYTMLIGPAIDDLTGNAMDQDQDGTPGEENQDRHIATVELESPDLRPVSTSVPTTASFGDDVAISWSVENIGTDAALEQWSDRIYLSTDMILDSNDISLATVPANTGGSLNAGSAYSQTATVTLPLSVNLDAGNYYFIVVADVLGEQAESTEANNQNVSEQVAIGLPPLPDLVVSNILAPVEGLSNQPIEVTWTVTNQGAGDASGEWKDFLFLSTDQVAGNDQFYGSFEYSGTIPAGQSITRTQRINLPRTISGNHWVIVQTDAENTLFEHNAESNNTAIDDQPIAIRLSPFPNLQVSSVAAPVTAFSSQSTVVEWVTTNVGTGATSASSWRDAVYLSLDTTLDATDVYLGEASNSSYLNAGESYNNSLAVTLPRGIDGNYHFLVSADWRNQVFEFEDEADNVGGGNSTNVQLTPPPDLQVSSVQAPPLAFSGQTMALSWTVQNRGSGRTLESAWYDDIYMSEDEELVISGENADRYLGRRYHNGTLEVDESYVETMNVNLPIGISGEYFFFARTDSLNQVYEHASESNNTHSSVAATNVLLTPPPDLEIAQLVTPTTALAGHALTVNFTVENYGASGTPNYSWIDAVYLSSDAVLDSNDLKLGDIGHYGALPDFGFYDVSHTFVLPDGIQGEFYVLVHTDQRDVVFELDNENNVRSGPAITIQSLPADLIVSAAGAPATGEAGKSVRVDYTVTNQGLGDTAVTRWTDRVYASTDDTFSGDDILLGSFTHEGLLDTGDSYSRSELVDLPFTFLGTYNLFVVADVAGEVFEINEGNNLSTALPLSVIRDVPDLQVLSVSTPTDILAGTEIAISWTVQNAGANQTNANYWYDEVWLSSDTTISGNDYRLGDLRHTNALGAGQQYTATGTFRLPDDLFGPLYLIVRTDHSNRVFEAGFESNNDGVSAVDGDSTAVEVIANPAATARPDLEVISVDAPLDALSGQPFSLTWTVQNNEVATSRSWYDAVYLSRDQIFDRDTDTYLGFHSRSGLAAGDSYTATQSFTIPNGLSGPFYVFVATDSGRSVDESGREANNVARDGSSMQVSLAPPADLVVGTITVPDSASLGSDATIQYTITNQGDNAALGSWYDSIYFSADDQWDLGDVLLGRILHRGDVAGGSSYSESLTASVPGLVPGDYQVIIRTDIRNHIPESNETNNLSASLDLVDVNIEALQLGVPATDVLAEGQSAFYRVDVNAGETLVVTLDSESATAANELYVRYGDVPSRSVFDHAFSDPLSPDQRLVIPFARGGTYYILAYGVSVPSPSPFTVTADVPSFSILEVGPDAGSNKGMTTVQILGSQFKNDGQVLLTGAGGERAASETWWKNGTELWATFDLNGLPTGNYDIRVDQGTESATGAGLFTVTNGPLGELDIQVDAPSTLRPGQPGVVTVNYANSGQTDIAAPVLTLAVTNALLKMADGSTSDRIEFLGIGPDGPAGILAPGGGGTLSLVYNPTVSTGNVEFSLSELPADEPIDWAERKDEARPAGVSPEAWNIVWANFTDDLGSTGAGLRAVLDDNANFLSQLGVRTSDTARLLRFELQQASGSLYESVTLSPASAGNAIDISATAADLDVATQLPLFFARSYASGVEGRFREGPLGRGWAHNWEISVEQAADGTVTVFQGVGTRVFTPNPLGGYRGLPGELGELTYDGTRFRLEEPAGIALQFGSNGLLESVSDRYDNTIVATYTSGRLTSLTHSDGESLTIEYNGQGQITQVVDQIGNQIRYNYDVAGEHLISVTGDGTTTYSYSATTAATAHALLSITYPDGAMVGFQYDAQGLQIGHSVNGGDEAFSYAFDSAGGITLTDLDGNSSELLLTDAGASGRITDAWGQVTQLFYNDEGLLTQVINPAGARSTFTYDEQGNLLSNLDALGQAVTFSYDSALQQVSSVRDPMGRTLGYTYDTLGNLLAVTYPDGSTEQFQPSPATNATAATINRRSQETRFTYDDRGLVLRKDYPDGTAATFTYDPQGNLLTAVDADSSVTFTYDGDELRRVTYDTGRYVEFAYDGIGRRIRMSDGDGYEVNYAYDSAGRLAELTDANANRIVKYTYDSRGHLVREDNGNGTSTTYQHGPANELLSVVNYDDDGTTINSRFDYTYNVAGRVASVTTLDGTTAFSYDATGQLTLVTLPSGRVIEYRYDAAGNRVSVTDDGVVTSYTANNLNQYVDVGGATYTYDADGNLISHTVDGVVWTYVYDSENRLVRTESDTGEVIEYVYDALGNRVASIQDGQRTEFLIDPTGWGDVVAQYGPTGEVSQFTYGIGLVGRVGPDGSTAYYDFDAIGNTVGISGVDGTYLNAYSYLPFGEKLASVEAVDNDFEYGGQWGVSQTGGPLDYMRARYYDPVTGHFGSVDPQRIQSGDINFYRYANNNPVMASDPTGEILFVPILVGAGIGAALDIGVQLATNGGNVGDISWGSVAVSAGLGALGGGIGSAGAKIGGAGARRAGFEFSHWIPARFSNPSSKFYKGLPRWLTQNNLNGNFVPRWLHAATDPYRLLKGMKKWGDHLYPPLLRQLLRVPGWLSGGLLGPLGGALTRLIRPSDPNDIVGPAGFGDEHWVTATEALPYTIRFENRAAATAPAQQVTINHPLDPDIDPRTFRLGNFGWGDLLFEVPENRAAFYGRLDVREEQGIFVDVVAGIDVEKGEAFWILQAIDPETGEPPIDASVGFLPPNDENHVGEGFVTYKVRSRRTAETGFVIDALATIIFDTEEPLDTPPIFNTIDAGIPTSEVDALPLQISDPSHTFLVSWSGQDDEGGSALASYSVYVSDNGGAFTIWLEDTDLTEASYVGAAGHTYAFYSRARDNAGNYEAAPQTPDATTTIGSGDVTPPQALDVLDIAPDPRNTSVTSVEFEASEELDLASLDESDFLLTRNGSSVSIPTGTLSFEPMPDAFRYRVLGLEALTQPEGDYVLTVLGSGLSDLAGNAGIGSPTGAWTIDKTGPTSQIVGLPQRQSTLTFPVTATGTDPTSGGVESEVASYEIYRLVNNGSWELWTTVPAADPVAMYTGQSQQSIGFYSVAIDQAGNRETKSPRLEASTYIPDLDAPASQVEAVNVDQPAFDITFSGSDFGGSGLHVFDVFVSVDDAAPISLGQVNAGTPAASGVYSGSLSYQAIADGSEHSYRFFTIGIDSEGNTETPPTSNEDVVVNATFAAPASLAVTEFDVQRGVSQRSFIQYLDVTFNTAGFNDLIDSINDVGTANDRIRLLRFGVNGEGPGEVVDLTGRVESIDQVMKIDFGANGIGGNRNSAIGNGYYRLQLDVDGDGEFDSDEDADLAFYRLFGDANGDRTVNNDDLATIMAVYGQQGMLDGDINGDGIVSSHDRLFAARNRGQNVDSLLELDD